MTTLPIQTGALAGVPDFAKYLTFKVHRTDGLTECLQQLARHCDGERLVVGLGSGLLAALGRSMAGLTDMPDYHHGDLSLAQDQADLFIWLRGSGGSEEVGQLLQQAQAITAVLADHFVAHSYWDAFNYGGRDLSGYEDGTENPEGDDALAAGFVGQGEAGIKGGSFVAVQPWRHQLQSFKQRAQADQDDVIGRRLSDNVEFPEAPSSAHVKRSAQESFAPEAFMLRRSMPWVQGTESGLVFVAFGKDLTAFDAIMKRMIGAEDGIVDGLFSFTQPVGGGFYWCPPIHQGGLDLRAII